MTDLFHSSWEVRHGAASGLREVIKGHGRGAGRAGDVPTNQMSSVNQLWLSDVALRLLCVLALDKFGDFVSDEVNTIVMHNTYSSPNTHPLEQLVVLVIFQHSKAKLVILSVNLNLMRMTNLFEMSCYHI